ncbi:hypothetical protein JTE90_013774 [Oedothorax gibbosus]|uniref:Mutator-like transposase domain-containing protein n=1 Tax=Oedothorax gibbosus TaxID=931172 RepID=A0AAV6UY44_9ARAC|nr:hypothetical protein JTE90_013774 [Oedothorax gibbosus]
MSIGGGYSNLREMFSAMDLPTMSRSTYSNEHAKVCAAWEISALKSMEEAAAEEKRLAIERGDVDVEGVPYFAVVADGSWAKRSYKTNCSFLSGMAAIIGSHTKKVLYLGVRNKFCATCARALQKNIEPPEHCCTKNWEGSSSAMESSIIAEGFLTSMQTYGVKYHQVIADGDSNVYKTILDANPYDTLTVEKIECKNHLLRNFCNKLKDLTLNAKLKHISLRREIGINILRVRSCIVKAIEFRSQEDVAFSERVNNLRSDILNSIYHIFGDHRKCASYFCSKIASGKCLMDEIEGTELLYSLMSILNSIAYHSKSLIINATNNIAEEFNSIIAKFLGGKRINYCLGESYKARCNAAAVSHNTRTPLSEVLGVVKKSRVGKFVQKYERSMSRIRAAAAKRRKKKMSRKTLFPNTPRDSKSYGPQSEKPDMPEELYSEKKERFLTTLQVTAERRDKIEKETRLQRDSPAWLHERRKRLTASHFGSVCIRLAHTSCKNLVKAILYSNFDNRALRYGREHEKDAIRELETKFDIKVSECGLFFRQHRFSILGSNNRMDDDGLVEMLDLCNRGEEVEEVLQKYVENNPNNLNARIYLCVYICNCSSDTEKIISNLEMLANLCPSDERILLLLEHWAQSEKKLKDCLKLNFMFLDYPSNGANLLAWQLLSNFLNQVKLRNCDDELKKTQSLWKYRHKCWNWLYFNPLKVPYLNECEYQLTDVKAKVIWYFDKEHKYIKEALKKFPSLELPS